jgi:MoxR-like ATPase
LDVNALAAAIAAQIQPAGPAASSGVSADDLAALAEAIEETRQAAFKAESRLAVAEATLTRHDAEYDSASHGLQTLRDLGDAFEQKTNDRLETLESDRNTHGHNLTQLFNEVDALKRGAGSALESRLSALESALSTAAPTTRARAALSVSASSNPILNRLAPYYSAGSDNAATVCALLSPPSFGKSHTARELGRAYDVFLEHGCSDDLDEIATLLGTITPDGKGAFLQVDGVLAQAVRAASEGRTVLLFLDEIFRLSPRAQEWLLSFLAPSKAGFTLRTRRALPDGTLETLTAPTDRLHILCAANLTQTEPAEAFWSRLHKIRIPFDKTALAAIAEQVLSAHGIPAAKLPAAFADLMDSTRRACKEGALRYPADIRLLARAAAHAPAPDEAEVARLVAASLPDACAVWDGELGDTLPQSVAAISALGAVFSKALGI